MSKHYLYGGSNAAVWSKCNGSPFISVFAANESNEAMKRGTRIHHLAELILTNGVIPTNTFTDELVIARAYSDRVTAMFPEPEIEVSCVVSEMVGGTIDGVATRDGELYLWDLKTGFRPVYATFNQQLLAYLWFYMRNKPLIPSVIHLGIWHEATGDFDWWDVSFTEVMEACAIFEQATQASTKTLTPGEHCTKCRALARCSVGGGLPVDPLLVTNADIADAYSKTKLYNATINKIENEAEALAKNDNLPGYMLRPGKRKALKWYGSPPREIGGMSIYKEEPMTPTQVAKALGKDGEEFIVSSALACRPESDMEIFKI